MGRTKQDIDRGVYCVDTYMNMDSLFGEYTRGNRLAPSQVSLIVEADNPEDAARRAWDIGNRVFADDKGTRWPPHIRSVSVGDVMVIHPQRPSHDREVALSVDRFGFGEQDVQEILNAVNTDIEAQREAGVRS